MATAETFAITTTWTGNRGSGTSDYRAYARDHEIASKGKSLTLPGSSVAKFRGDASRYSPEDLLVASLSACHMLWFLHLCADAGIVVTSYVDRASGTLRLNADGSGQFSAVVLAPDVGLADEARRGELADVHERAHAACFLARSVNFPVTIGASVSS